MRRKGNDRVNNCTERTERSAIRHRAVKSSVNDRVVRLEPADLSPHVRVLVPARAARIYDRME